MMLQLNLVPLMATILCGASLLISVSAKRPFNHRSDLEDMPPVSELGYEVPLVGSKTCVAESSCTSSLPSPSLGKSLQQLTLGRGVLTYTCNDRDSTDQASYLSESVDVYDVAAILPFLPNEATFHALVQQFYAYDYSELQNSTLQCVGNVYTDYGASIVSLYNFDTFPVEVNTTVLPPENGGFNTEWVFSTTIDGAWEVYRVETYGGAVPPNCRDRNGTFDLGFAAEYWFYH